VVRIGMTRFNFLVGTGEAVSHQHGVGSPSRSWVPWRLPITPRASLNRVPRLNQGLVFCRRRADMARALKSGLNIFSTASTCCMLVACFTPSALLACIRPSRSACAR
jgi:hypothetical protein